MVTLVILLFVGSSLVVTGLIWSGWWGSWATADRASIVVFAPLGAVFFSMMWLSSHSTGLWLAVGAVVIVVVAGFAVWFGIHLPSWVGPRWYREARREWDDEVLPADLVPPRAERMRRPLGRAEQRPVKTQRLAMNRPRPRPWS